MARRRRRRAACAFGDRPGPRGGRRSAFVVACLVALGVSIAPQAAGVSGQRAEHDRRTARVAAMTGHRASGRRRDRRRRHAGGERARVPARARSRPGRHRCRRPRRRSPLDAGGNAVVSLLRTLVGAAFLGAVTDAMLLGHWYLVQPGLPRRLLHELVDALGWVWPIEVRRAAAADRHVQRVDRRRRRRVGRHARLVLGAPAPSRRSSSCSSPRRRSREREYSAVMAATGLLYLAILTAFGTDLVARAVLVATDAADGYRTVVRPSSVAACPDPSGAARSASGLIAIPVKLFNAVRQQERVVQPARRAHDEPHPLPQGVRRRRRRGARRAHRQGLRGLQGPLRASSTPTSSSRSSRRPPARSSSRSSSSSSEIDPIYFDERVLRRARRQPEAVRAAGPGDGGGRQGRHRSLRDAQQAVHGGDPGRSTAG